MSARQPLGQLLLHAGLITESQLEIALQEQQKTGAKIGETAVNLGFVPMDAMLNCLAGQLGLRFARFTDLPKVLPDDLYPTVKFMKQYSVVPLGRFDGKLRVAMADPLDTYATEALALFAGCPLEPLVCSSHDVLEAIEQYFGAGVQMASIMDDMRPDDLDTGDEASQQDVHQLKDMAAEAPIIRLVNMLITRAVEDGASDIHIEVFESRLKVRYRMDGVLVEADSLPKRLQSPVISRIKIMAKMNIAERRLPQDGKIKLRLLGKDIDLRVSTIPTLYGESIVIRVLDKTTTVITLESLGFPDNILPKFKQMIAQPYGMLLVTGPTGSGKTTTLYGALSRINSTDRKIITIEDPVEYEIEGINQIQVKPKIGLTFASGLRHIVRQDPDVIMVGEIRDRETAEIAVNSALTGHLVFSTLHTNDAPGAITRLLDMGIESFLLASSITGVLAQRLVRVICPHCSTEAVPHRSEMERLGLSLADGPFHTGHGCDQCRSTGYLGRTGIFELMPVTDRLKALILEEASADILRRQAVEEGMQTLRDAGIGMVKSGVTTIEEVLRITQEQASGELFV